MYREMAKLQRSTCAPRRVNVRVVISELSLLERGWILRENVRTCNGKKLWRRKKFEQGDNTKNLIIVIISMWNREVICPNNLSCLFIPKNQSSRHLLINNKIINNKFRKRFQRSIRYYQPFIAKLSIYLRIFEYFPSLFPRNPKPLPEKRLRRPFFRWWIKGKLSAQTIRASVRSVRGETLSSARLLRVHRSALSDNRIRTSRIKRGILLKLARQLLHFDPLFFLSFFFFARAAWIRQREREEGKKRVGSFHSENRSNRCREAAMTCPPFFSPASSFFLSSLLPYPSPSPLRVSEWIGVKRESFGFVSLFVRANV